MTEKKELKNEELETVSGGYCDDDGVDKYLPNDHGAHINKENVQHYIGHKVYVVADSDREEYYWGTVISSTYQDDDYMHRIFLEGANDYWLCVDSWVGSEKPFRGDYHTVFLKNN